EGRPLERELLRSLGQCISLSCALRVTPSPNSPALYFAAVNRVLVLLSLIATAVAACRRSPTPAGRLRASADSDSAAFASFFRTARDSADSVLRTPRLITEATVVVFWLRQGDTLDVDQASEASDDLRYYTQQVAPTLKANDIQLVATNAETVYVSLPDHK